MAATTVLSPPTFNHTSFTALQPVHYLIIQHLHSYRPALADYLSLAQAAVATSEATSVVAPASSQSLMKIGTGSTGDGDTDAAALVDAPPTGLASETTEAGANQVADAEEGSEGDLSAEDESEHSYGATSEEEMVPSEKSWTINSQFDPKESYRIEMEMYEAERWSDGSFDEEAAYTTGGYDEYDEDENAGVYYGNYGEWDIDDGF
ncbi:hypothetical protein IAT38_002315 [Cryptococcus sp. DSM 104549]